MVEIQWTTSVRPASYDSQSSESKSIELNPWDLQLLLFSPIQKGLLFHKPPPSQEKYILETYNCTTLIDHLKSSLSRTLEFFPPLAGRLSILTHSDDSRSFFIDCNNAGAEFIYAVAPTITVASILEPVYVPRIVHSFFPLNGVRNCDVSKPLLGVQVTELADGLFIGCSINHAVVDGSSFWHFFNSWSEISRGFDKISKLPVFNPYFPDVIDRPIRIPLGEKLLNHELTAFSFPPQLEERVFHFSKGNISGLKEKANAEMNTTRISSLQSLMAHLWQSIIRCRSSTVHIEQETKFHVAIGVRPRLQPPLPQGYFGNAVYFEAVSTKVGELLEHGRGWVASEMNKKIAAQTDDEIVNYFKCWVKNPRMLTSAAMTDDGLLPSSSPRFIVYGNDFGWGKPVAMRSGEADKFAGKVTFCEGAEKGSIEIQLCLLHETLVAMENDAEFMEFVDY